MTAPSSEECAVIYLFEIDGEIRGDILPAMGATDADVVVEDGRSTLRMEIIDRSELSGALTHMIDLGLDLVGMRRVG